MRNVSKACLRPPLASAAASSQPTQLHPGGRTVRPIRALSGDDAERRQPTPERRARAPAVSAHQRAFLAAFEALPFGLAILGADGQFVSGNDAARQIISSGAALTLREGRLRARDRGADRRLHECVQQCLIARLAGWPEVTMRLPKPDGHGAVIVRVGRLAERAEDAEGGEAAAILFLHDPERARQIDAAAIREVYGLTRVESELATYIAQGCSVEEAGGLLRVSRHTARKYLQQVFCKTGVSRQVDLVRLILAGPVFLKSRRDGCISVTAAAEPVRGEAA